MLVYVERTDAPPKRGSVGRRNALLDTADGSTNVQLESRLGVNGDGRVEASMISIAYDAPPWKGLKEGSWYDIPLGTFEGSAYQPVTPELAGGAFLRGRLSMPARPIDFTAFLARQRTAAVPTAPLPPSLATTGGLELHVINCGQGNWNEVHATSLRLIYDMGASQWFSRAEVEGLVRAHALAGETRDVHVVISHWDVDHYQGILGCTDADLAKIKSVIAPSQIPATQTFTRVHNRLTNLGVPMVSMQPAPRPAGSRRIVLVPGAQVGPFRFFRAVPGRSRNQTGIVLAVEGGNRTALLTGDHHYEKILAAVASQVQHRRVVLVVPHHAGEAGNLDSSAWSTRFSGVAAAISVGPNGYGHPLQRVEHALSQLPLEGTLMKTQVAGDLVYLL